MERMLGCFRSRKHVLWSLYIHEWPSRRAILAEIHQKQTMVQDVLQTTVKQSKAIGLINQFWSLGSWKTRYATRPVNDVLHWQNWPKDLEKEDLLQWCHRISKDIQQRQERLYSQVRDRNVESHSLAGIQNRRPLYSRQAKNQNWRHLVGWRILWHNNEPLRNTVYQGEQNKLSYYWFIHRFTQTIQNRYWPKFTRYTWNYRVLRIKKHLTLLATPPHNTWASLINTPWTKEAKNADITSKNLSKPITCRTYGIKPIPTTPN